MAISFKVSITLEGAHVGQIIQESPATEWDEAEAEREREREAKDAAGWCAKFRRWFHRPESRRPLSGPAHQNIFFFIKKICYFFGQFNVHESTRLLILSKTKWPSEGGDCSWQYSNLKKKKMLKSRRVVRVPCPEQRVGGARTRRSFINESKFIRLGVCVQK